MKINSNIFALSVHENLRKTQNALERGLVRLSSGQRINSAKDDAAGLYQATGLDSQIRGLRQAVRNANDGVGVIRTADAAIGQLSEIVQSMRERAVQASNGTLSSDQRSRLSDEVSALLSEYSRIVNETSFNGIHLLNGSEDAIELMLGATATGLETFRLEDLRATESFEKTVGYGEFERTEQVTDVPLNVQEMVHGDFNRDGNEDIITVEDSGEGWSILLGNGDGTFQVNTQSGPGGNYSIAAGDLNGDGIEDLALGYNTGSDAVHIMLGNGDGTFRYGTEFAPNADPHSLAIQDLDNDGHNDIVVGTSGSENVQIFMNDGSGEFDLLQSVDAGSTIASLGVGDLNGDGVLDIVTGSAFDTNMYVLLGNGNGSFQTPVAYTSQWSTTGVKLADVNNDGALDVLASSDGSDSIMIFLGNGDGTLQGYTETTQVYNAGGLDVGDINGDGILDLVGVLGSGSSGDLRIFLGNGDGTFEDHDTIIGNGRSLSVALADLDNDNVLDLIVGGAGNSQVDTYLGMSETVTALGDLDFESAAEAQDAIGILDTTLNNLSSARAMLGAYENRLDARISNILVQQENLTLAHDEITSVDIAIQTAELVRNQILQQAQIAVLSQANLLQSTVLDLLN